MKAQLNKTFIDSLKPKEKEYSIFDIEITGFGIKVTPAGRKVYFYRYRNKNNKQKKYTIGTHGQLTLKQARDIAWGKVVEVHNRLDPAAQVAQDKTEITLSEFCERYITDYARIHKKPSSVKEDEFLIKSYIKPKLGHLILREITRIEVAALHRDLSATPYNANHTRALLSKMFNLAEEWGLRPENTNPCRAVKKYKEHFRTRYLSKVELESLSKVLAELDGVYTNPFYVAYIRLLLLTGARVSEIQNAKWEWIDFDQRLLLLPDSKTGKRVIFMTEPVMTILNSLPRVSGHSYILFGRRLDKPIGAPYREWDEIREKAGLTDFRAHDLRHSYATICNQLECGENTIAALLGHRSRSTITQRYIHHVDSHVRAASEKVAAYIGKVLGIKFESEISDAAQENSPQRKIS
jgi:integrase